MESDQPIRRIHYLLGQYAHSHQHPSNVLIHWICVPIIVWCVLAFAWAIHPVVACLGTIAALGYYLWLSPPMAWVMAACALLGLLSLMWLPHTLPAAGVLFVLAWVFQFVGHHIEGRKPSFFDDLHFLLVGPLFLLAKLFRKARVAI
jgi:uncharacterized membrane protein YGL010W